MPELSPSDLEIWFFTGSQALYGEETLDQVADQSQEIAAALGEAEQIPVRIVWKPVLTTSDAIRRACLDATSSDTCVGVVAWMHTFSPAKMWIAGLGALTFLTRQDLYTLPLSLVNLQQGAYGQVNYGYLAAGSVIAMVPCVILFVALQRFYVAGLSAGAVKG